MKAPFFGVDKLNYILPSEKPLKLCASSQKIPSLKGALKVSFAYLSTMFRERELHWREHMYPCAEKHPCGEDMVCMPSGGNGLPMVFRRY